LQLLLKAFGMGRAELHRGVLADCLGSPTLDLLGGTRFQPARRHVATNVAPIVSRNRPKRYTQYRSCEVNDD
jgi:hypothetical protein